MGICRPGELAHSVARKKPPRKVEPVHRWKKGVANRSASITLYSAAVRNTPTKKLRAISQRMVPRAARYDPPMNSAPACEAPSPPIWLPRRRSVRSMWLTAPAPKYLSRTSGSMKLVSSCMEFGSMSAGHETYNMAQPTSAVLTALAPNPPKAILPRPIASAAPSITSHHGALAGSRNANSRQETAPEKSSTLISWPMIF